MLARHPALRGLAIVAALMAATSAAAQDHATHNPAHHKSGEWQATAAADLEALEKKYLGLLEAMPASAMSWRPGEGVRSVGEVFGHVAIANYGIGRIIGGQMPADLMKKYPNGKAWEAVTDKAEMTMLLKASFDAARKLVTSIPDTKLGDEVNMFGNKVPLRQAMLLLVTHNHEHLGQMIAYARSNNVTPPWSGGE